ncbi:putative uncharacterized protein C7orf78 [Ciona intestinalis]
MTTLVTSLDPSVTSHNIGFVSKLKFDSESASLRRRSNFFSLPGKSPRFDVWKLPPPNFNPQAFEPEPLPRNSREAIKPWRYEQATKSVSAPTSKERRRNDKRKNEYFEELERSKFGSRAQTCGNIGQDSRSDLQLRFRVVDPYAAKINFVKKGKHKDGVYENLRPHDFRQYPKLKSLGLPEFVTSFERDFDGNKARIKGLSTLTGNESGGFLRQVEIRTKADYAIPRYPQYDVTILHPRLSYPNKIAAYTRHRRIDRSARSAFLERAEAMMEKRAREIKAFRELNATTTERSPEPKTHQFLQKLLDE